eukprot:COSAG02_NODE_43971_length_370_cov_0.664207_1_plen_92_part_00
MENRPNAGAGKIDTDMGDLLVPTSNLVPTQGHPHGRSAMGSGEPNSGPTADLTGNSRADGTGKAAGGSDGVDPGTLPIAGSPAEYEYEFVA